MIVFSNNQIQINQIKEFRINHLPFHKIYQKLKFILINFSN